MSDENSHPSEAKEPIVLDAEGHVLHDPLKAQGAHQKAEFKVVSLGNMNPIAKFFLGGAFVALLLLGLTVAGVALGIVVVGFLARTIFRTKRR